MNKRIDEYLNKISKFSLDEIDYDYIYRELICYNNRNIDDCVMDTLRVFTEMVNNDKKYINMDNDSLLISNTSGFVNGKRIIKLGIFNKLDNVIFNIDSIISYCNKKRISFFGKLNNYDNVGYLEINVSNIDDSMLLIDYINNKLGKNLYSVNPLFFSVGCVMVSLDSEYSYIEIMSSYLYRFIMDMKRFCLNVDYNNFKSYMLDNYYKIDNQIDMYRYVDFNTKGISLSKFFANLDEVTNMIMYLFNGNDIDEFKEYYCKLNRKNSKNVNKYLDYDNIDGCCCLFEELVLVMYLNYGEDYTRDNIIKYMNSGKVDYITRKNNLRRKIMAEKRFIIYLMSIDLDKKIDKIINNIKFEKKKKILEDVCKCVFLNYIDRNVNYSKIQVARCLIRMSYGDYSTVTRCGNARKLAMDNIDSDEIVKLIKMTLEIDRVCVESELYELYADYIERLCVC